MEAEPLAKRAVEALEKNPVPVDDELAYSLGMLGEIYAKQGRASEARPFFRKATEIMELRVRSTNDVEEFFRLGYWYIAQDRLPDARRISEKAVALCKATKRLGHPDVARALVFLAEVRRSQNGFAEAESLCQEALPLARKALGQQHPALAAIFGCLAQTASALGVMRTRPGSTGKRSESHMGPWHPQIATLLYNLGSLYVTLSKLDDAESALHRAIEIRKHNLVPTHPDVANGSGALAHVYALRGNYGRAEQMTRDAVAILERAFGPIHQDLVMPLNTLAEIRLNQRRYKEAEAFSCRVLDIVERLDGPGDPKTAEAIANLAVIYIVQHRYREAEPLLKQSLAIIDATPENAHQSAGLILKDYAVVLKKLKRKQEAAELERRAQALGPSSGQGVVSR